MSSWAVLNLEPSQNDGWKSKMDEKLLCFAAAASAHDSKKSVEEHKSMHSKTTVAAALLLAVAKTAADFDASAKQFHP